MFKNKLHERNYITQMLANSVFDKMYPTTSKSAY